MNKTKTTSMAVLALAAAGTLLGGSGVQAQTLAGKSDRFLIEQAAKHPQHGWTHVIVRFAGTPTSAQKAQLKALKAGIYRNLEFIHSAALAVPARNLPALAALPFVQRISADLDVKKSDEFIVESSGAAMAANQYGVTGKSVTVAVLDSGVRTCQDMPGSTVIGAVTFVPPPPGQTAATNDSCGHGTHVAGIIAGSGFGSSDSYTFRHFKGVAPGVKIVNVRVLDDKGQGTVSQVISGIQWCVQQKTAASQPYNIRAINLSLGHPVGESYTTDPLCQAVEAAWKAGIVVVCAAGNEGRITPGTTVGASNEGYGTNYGSIQSPGNDPYVITVGAMKSTDMVFAANGSWTHNRNNDHVSTYSSRGPSRLDLVLKPDILAPGNKVISLHANNTLLTNQYAATNTMPPKAYTTNLTAPTNKYYVLSGSSMAAPVVTGAVALMLDKDRSLTPDIIKARLMLSADKWADPAGNADPCTYGAGYLNIPAAMASTAKPNQAATSPSLSEDANGNVYLNMDRAVWGTDVNGQRAVWGVTSVNDLRAVWGTRAIWGSSLNVLDASRALWGQSVWSDRAVWGTSTSTVDLSSTAINGE